MEGKWARIKRYFLTVCFVVFIAVIAYCFYMLLWGLETGEDKRQKAREVARQEGRLIGDYWVITIEGCEYLSSMGKLAHKGNCKRCWAEE